MDAEDRDECLFLCSALQRKRHSSLFSVDTDALGAGVDGGGGAAGYGGAGGDDGGTGMYFQGS